jgi:hypothetical protein
MRIAIVSMMPAGMIAHQCSADRKYMNKNGRLMARKKSTPLISGRVVIASSGRKLNTNITESYNSCPVCMFAQVNEKEDHSQGEKQSCTDPFTTYPIYNEHDRGEKSHHTRRDE